MLKTKFWGAPGLVMGPCIVEIDRIVKIDVQYHFEVNRCRNEEVKIDRIVIRDVRYQFEVNRCSRAISVGGDSGQDGQTDRQTAEITTISPSFSKSVRIIRCIFK
ncbi:hypothetical protein DPMN_145473 [Dreissena polymorpha]|uniref:Uncharacterized protein n=1 Tax=Dreissena polymorpha TaxID=45954 RepID=A0A9D4F635_DREPO|nr:hypothetical protein DPMN_145473 [Dreissena polymorpha]